MDLSLTTPRDFSSSRFPGSWATLPLVLRWRARPLPFHRDLVEPRSLTWTVHASWPLCWVTCCRHFVITHLMAHGLGYTCGRLWLSVSEDRLLILDGDDARTPGGSAPLRCTLVRLCIGITSRTLWSPHPPHPGASRVDDLPRFRSPLQGWTLCVYSKPAVNNSTVEGADDSGGQLLQDNNRGRSRLHESPFC